MPQIADDGKIFIDNTILRAVAECDTRSLMRHIFDFADPNTSAPLVSGQAAHEAFAVFFRAMGREQQRVIDGKGPFSDTRRERLIEECLDTFTTLYSEVGSQQPDNDRLSLGNCQNVMRAWFQKHITFRFPFRIFPDLIEIPFALPLDPEERFMFCGRLDALVQAPDGLFYVLDHKTTGRMDSIWKRSFQMDSQFGGYVWAAQLHTKHPIAGTYVNGLEFSKLPGPSGAQRLKKDGTPYKIRECNLHSTTYDECRLEHVSHDLFVTIRTQQQLADWQRTAITLAKKFARLYERFPTLIDVQQRALQQGLFNHGCKWCEFKDWCGTGRPTQHVRSMFVHQPWRPFDFLSNVVAEPNSTSGS